MKQCKYEKRKGHGTRGGLECSHGKHFKAATHKIKANDGDRKGNNTSNDELHAITFLILLSWFVDDFNEK